MTSPNHPVETQTDDNQEPVKKGLFRLPGLIAFIAMTILIVGGSYFFAGSIIKSVIESTGTSINGARVEVNDVSLGLFPASVTLYQMEVADPDQPMKNLIEFDTAKASIEFTKLLMGQVIIPDLSMQGLKLETDRDSSGAVDKESDDIDEKSAQDQPGALDSFSQKLPSASEILAREPLLVDQRKKELESAYQQQKAEWDKIRANLPNTDKLKSYETLAKAITNTKITSLQDFEKARSELTQLKSEIEADKQVIDQARAQLSESKTVLQTHVVNLKNAPQEDWQRIKAKYSFDQQGLGNVSGLLFGDKIGDYTHKALYWYDKIKPYLDKASNDGDESNNRTDSTELAVGRFVRFPEEKPLPDFLIKVANISMTLPQGELDLTINNITHQQSILGQPTLVKASSSKLKNIGAVNLEAVLDYRKKVSQSDIDFAIEKLNLDNLDIGSNQGQGLTLGSAQSDIKGKMSLIDHLDVTGNIDASFTQAEFTGTATNRFTEELLAALQSIESFNVSASIGGQVEQTAMKISSDIDSKLGKAFSKRLNEKTNEFKNQISQKLNEKLASYMPDSNGLSFTGSEGLDDYSNKLQDLMSTKLDDFADQQKQKAKDKVTEKMSEKFKGLF